MKNQLLTNNKVDLNSVQNLDFRGRRITNAGNSVNNQDYVTKAELQALQTQIDAINKKLGIS